MWTVKGLSKTQSLQKNNFSYFEKVFDIFFPWHIFNPPKYPFPKGQVMRVCLRRNLFIPGICCSFSWNWNVIHSPPPPWRFPRIIFHCFFPPSNVNVCGQRHRILYNVSSNLIYFILCVCLCAPSSFSIPCSSCQQCTRLSSPVWCAFLLPLSTFF